jgi:hypothetical protein
LWRKIASFEWAKNYKVLSKTSPNEIWIINHSIKNEIMPVEFDSTFL